MPKPVTPLVGCDAFVLNEQKQVLLIKRVDSDLWALPGGFHDLGETPAKCAARECLEETGYNIEVIRLLGFFVRIAMNISIFLGKMKNIVMYYYRVN